MRPMVESDIPAVAKAMKRAYYAGRKKKNWINENWNPEKNHELFYGQFIFEKEGYQKVIVDDAFLVVYASDSSWYDPCRIELVVCLVLRIGPGSSFENLCRRLDEIAIENGCNNIRAGTAFYGVDSVLVNKWLSCGYERVETVVNKRIGD